MPNWTAIANQIAEGMYGDDWRRQRAQEQEMKMNEQRMQLAGNADARAAAGEARAADEFSFSKEQRPMLLKQLQQKIDAGELDLKEAQNQLALFDAQGGVAGEAGRRKAKEEREVGTYNQNIKASNAQIANMQADNARAQSAEQRAAKKDELLMAAQRLENEFAEATKQSRIAGVNEQNDPRVRDSQRLRALIDYAKIAPDEETEWLSEEIKKLSIRNEIRKADQVTAGAASPNAVVPTYPQSDVNRRKMSGL
jgi:hypothetical protein